MLGGEDAAEQQVYTDVESFDPASRTWSQLPPLPAARQGIGAAVLGDRLLLPGGGPSAGGREQTAVLLELSPQP